MPPVNNREGMEIWASKELPSNYSHPKFHIMGFHRNWTSKASAWVRHSHTYLRSILFFLQDNLWQFVLTASEMLVEM